MFDYFKNPKGGKDEKDNIMRRNKEKISGKKAIQIAEELARKVHAKRMRDCGVLPYISHPEKVVDILKSRGATNSQIALGWLHDILEEKLKYYRFSTFVLRSYIEAFGFRKCVIDSLFALTRMKGESRLSYMIRVAKNRDAVIVKIADNEANNDSLRRHKIERSIEFYFLKTINFFYKIHDRFIGTKTRR